MEEAVWKPKCQELGAHDLEDWSSCTSHTINYRNLYLGLLMRFKRLLKPHSDNEASCTVMAQHQYIRKQGGSCCDAEAEQDGSPPQLPPLWLAYDAPYGGLILPLLKPPFGIMVKNPYAPQSPLVNCSSLPVQVFTLSVLFMYPSTLCRYILSLLTG